MYSTGLRFPPPPPPLPRDPPLPTSFPHLRHSAAVPTEDELKVIHSAESWYRRRRDELKKVIGGLEESLRRAQQELTDVQLQIDAHANLTSSIRKIPSGILRDIFSYVIPDASLLGMHDMTLFPPWTLLRVCKHWHDVCLEYGSLWSSIRIADQFGHLSELPWSEDPHLSNGDLGQFLDPTRHRALRDAAKDMRRRPITRAAELLELQLQRSKEASLSVIFEPRPRNDYAQPFLRIILPFIHKCTHIQGPPHILAELPSGDLEQLRHLVVNYSEANRMPQWPLYSDIDESPVALESEQIAIQRLSTCPNVSTVSALYIAPSDWPRDHPSPTLLLQAKLLTNLVLTNVHRNHHGPSGWWSTNETGDGPPRSQLLGTLLPQLTNLVDFQLYDTHEAMWSSCWLDGRLSESSLFSNPVGTSADTRPRITLPKLSVLVVSGCRLVGCHIMDSIMAPALRTLDWTGILDYSITEFLAVSGCELGTLRLITGLKDEAVNGFFQLNPAVWSHLHTLQLAHHGKIALFNPRLRASRLPDPPPPDQDARSDASGEDSPPDNESTADSRGSDNGEDSDYEDPEELLGTVRGTAILELLTRSSPSSRTPECGTTAHPTDIFPNLQFVALSLLSPSLDAVLTMLESRRAPVGRVVGNTPTPQLLKGCAFRRLLSRRYTFNKQDEEAADVENHTSTILQLDYQVSPFYPWDTSSTVPYSYARNHAYTPDPNWYSASTYRPRLSWANELYCEPMELDRLDRLQEEGLDLWIKYCLLHDTGGDAPRWFSTYSDTRSPLNESVP